MGVKDNGKIAGVRSEEEAYMIEAAAKLYCKPQVEFSIRNYIIENKTVLEVCRAPGDRLRQCGNFSSYLHFASGQHGFYAVVIHRLTGDGRLGKNTRESSIEAEFECFSLLSF